MYQVVINDKFYIDSIYGAQCLDGTFATIDSYSVTRNKLEGKLFDNEVEAKSISEEVSGRVIKYIEDKEIIINCSINTSDVIEQLRKIKNG